MAGLDRNIIDEIDWRRGVSSVRVDTRSDFILSPHFDAIFNHGSERLIEQCCQKLRAGTYQARLPITFSVPKGSFLTRPGSILEPADRLIHQVLSEQCLGPIENELDRNRVFSQVPSDDEDHLFEPSHLGWDRYQTKVASICRNHSHILKADISNYFETIPQHTVINLLSSVGVQQEIVNLVEEQLSAFRQRSSTGIIQGIFPSDILGNFYLSNFDADCDLHDFESARYVDDIYVGFQSELSARRELVRLNERLRQNGLAFNPLKTKVEAAEAVIDEDQEIDTLFAEAREEIEDTISFLRASGYGFQGDWIDGEGEEIGAEIELNAVRYLLLEYEAADSQKDKIERFCLPILRGANDDLGVDLVIDSFSRRPSQTRLYASYLTHFTQRDQSIVERVCRVIEEDNFYCDYQRMYMLAAILNANAVSPATVRKSLRWLEGNQIGPETKALCAIFAAKFGSANQKRAVRVNYENEGSEYVRSATLFASQYFPSAEKRAAKRAWGGQSEINALIRDVI